MEYIFTVLSQVFEWQNLLIMFLGVAAGIVIGAMPGLSYTMGIALMLPVTFGMPSVMGMLFLIGVYCGGVFGGSITAILIKTPGTAASAATVADGFALSQQGRASLALNMAIYASVIGGLISGIALLVAAPQIANFALKFGAPEYFMLALFGLTIISSVSGKSISKGLVMVGLGLLVSTVGTDLVTGDSRFAFGTSFLTAGIDLIPAIVGLFAISEIFNQVERGVKSIIGNTHFKNEKFGLRQLIPFRKTLFKSSIIGVIVGAIPGTGATISSFIGYKEARRTSKNPESYGKGNLDGIAAAESANNGTAGATLIPMMTLGIPGDSGTAILMGALIMQGLVPGPQLFTKYGDLVYAIMIGVLIINVIMFLQAKLAIRLFARVSLIPSYILLPIVLGLCLVGSYAVNNALYSVGIALVFGVVGYILQKVGYPVTPMLIAIVLGPLAESSLRQSLILSQGSFTIFFTRPISFVFFLLCLLSVCLPYIQRKWNKNITLKSTGSVSKTK